MYINVKEKNNKLYITELNQDYKLTFKVEDNFKPELFVESSFPESEFSSLIDGTPLEKIQFNSISEFKDYKFRMRDLDNSGLYGDIPVEYQYIRAKYSHDDKQFTPRYWLLDIETGVPKTGFPNPELAESPIILIQIAESDNNMRYVFGMLNMYTPKENETFFYYPTEDAMLLAFKDFMMERTPATTVAWNGDGFDFVYIINRFKKIGLPPELLSPFGILEDHKALIFGTMTKIQKPLGFSWVDYIEAFKRTIPQGQDSWSLEHMSKVVLGDKEGGKLDYKHHGFRDMRAFITRDYDPELDIHEDSKLKKYFNTDVQLFTEEWYQLFVSYGVIDVDVLKAMDQKKGILNTLTFLAQTMSVNLYDVFATVKPWQIHIYNKLYDRNQLVPAKSPFDTYKIPGGHVYAKPGLYNWVCSFDVRSLYPFCMICLNMSPETYIQPKDVPADLKELTKAFTRYVVKEDDDIQCEDIYMALPEEHKQKITELLVKYNFAMSPNGALFKKDFEGILPELTFDIFTSRKKFKKLQKENEIIREGLKAEGKDYSEVEKLVQSYNVKQLVAKVLINAEYGAVANDAMNIANSDLAGGITAYGRYNLKVTSKNVIDRINAMNPKFSVFNVQKDTDASYICLDSVVKVYQESKPDITTNEIVEFLDQFCKKVVSPFIQSEATKIATQMNAMQDEILWEREAISRNFISSGRKRYACLLLDDEGTRLVTPKKKIVGLEIKRSSTPASDKKALDKVIDLIFEGNNENLVDFIEMYKKNYSKIPVEKTAIPSGVSDITKFLENPSLSMPQHVRASVVHNNIIEKLNLTNYAPIVNGDKIKLVFLKKNPITTAEAVAFNDIRFLSETGLDKFINFEKMYERSFLSPTTTLTDVIGWNTSAQQLLSGLF